ncbi:MAG: hypothetical protein AMJ41_03620 [candidate division Zixibacteria bacterium DG_27]|nr:MAG: hypothetical protein AMJ41_03620 [candidate division Zixibacteria bacterium DG_27]
MRLLGFYLNRSIRTKLTAVMVTGLAVVAIFVTVFFPTRQKHLAFEELKTKAVSLARLLAYNVSPGLEFQDLEAVQEAVSGVQTDVDVINLQIFDREKNTFYSYSSGKGSASPLGSRLGENEVLELPDRLVLSTPVYTNRNRIGSLTLEISTLGVLQQVRDNRDLTLMVSLLLFLMGIALSSLLAGHLTKPLLRLTEITRKVSTGDLTYHIDIKAKDEIGHLASSFNNMVSSLREAQQRNRLYLQKIEKSNLILQEQRKEIEAYSHTLEERVEERTARLNQAYQELSEKNIELERTLEALNRSQERLREAEKLAVIGEIGSRVAHEILNPITALLSRTQIEMDYFEVTQNALKMMKEIIADWQQNLRTGKLSEYLLRKSPEKTDASYGEEDLALLSRAVEKNIDSLKRSQEFLHFFEHHIMRLVKIIDNLREMARSKRELEEVDVNSCLQEVAELYQDGVKKRKIKLTQKLTPNLPKIYTDYTELFQVFSNLLRNAMQAVESERREGGEVTFDSEVVGEETWVRVIDNGVGIPEENRPLIFEHGFSTKSRSEGTGLGLAISGRLVQEMGGELLLESSEPGAGATFLVKLPSMNKPVPAETSRVERVEKAL